MNENKGIVVVISVPCSLLISKLIGIRISCEIFSHTEFSGFGNEES